jgi:Regulator of volume decrease after cellular swelling
MREGNVFYGESAELSHCRAAASIEGDPNILQSVLLQMRRQPVAFDLHQNESDVKFTILWGPSIVEADFHDDIASDETSAVISGQLVITSEQLLFWMDEPSASIQQYDLRADATCIDLHALTSGATEFDNEDDENNKSGVYVQLSDGDVCDDSGYGSLQEITFCPISSPEHQSQSLFDAISKLITMHPIDPNDLPDGEAGTIPDNLDDQGNVWFGTGPFMTIHGIQDNDIDEDDDDDDEDDHLVVASNNDVFQVTSIDEEAERSRILERLDRLLIVPPEFEYPDDESVQELSAGNSQFDDADSGNELL